MTASSGNGRITAANGEDGRRKSENGSGSIPIFSKNGGRLIYVESSLHS